MFWSSCPKVNRPDSFHQTELNWKLWRINGIRGKIELSLKSLWTWTWWTVVSINRQPPKVNFLLLLAIYLLKDEDAWANPAEPTNTRGCLLAQWKALRRGSTTESLLHGELRDTADASIAEKGEWSWNFVQPGVLRNCPPAQFYLPRCHN